MISLIADIREAVADGQINDNDDWHLWTDTLIFREELRAIGEGMIETNKDQRTIIGYGKFKTLISQFEKSKEPIWLNPAINFFTDLQTEKDFRLERFKRITNSLITLIKFLDDSYYKKHIKPTI